MDTASENVIRFLEALQISRDRLIATLWNSLSVRGDKPGAPFLVLSGRPFRVHDLEGHEYVGSVSLGLRATPSERAPVDFTVEVLWDKRGWIVQTEVWVDSQNNQDLLQRFPERRAETLNECLLHIEAAVSDLSTCMLS